MKKIICPICTKNSVVYFTKNMYKEKPESVLFCVECDEEVTEKITDLWVGKKAKEEGVG
jgi:transcription elongation factor Elf1